jgi:glyoxylase-like metal-dependent hydrolase (beta-lactamase superfamily II)
MRTGDNVQCLLPVTFVEAALGAKIEVPTVDGKAIVRIPPGTQNGQTFRLRGKGAPSLMQPGAYWTNEENLANMLEYRVATVQNKLLPLQNKLMLVTSEDQEIAPGICPMPTPGHTPGHMALMIESDGERLLHMVDVSHLLFQPQNPDWSPVYDSLPELAAETRRRIFEKAAAEDLLVLAYHHPFPGLGYFRKQGEAFVWETKED